MNWRLVVMALTPDSGILWRTIGALAAECHRRKSAAFEIGASFLLFCCHFLLKRLQKRMIIPIHIRCHSPGPLWKSGWLACESEASQVATRRCGDYYEWLAWSCPTRAQFGSRSSTMGRERRLRLRVAPQEFAQSCFHSASTGF